ncbi:hypothetical protein CA983_43600, partial [Streptomyces swartbergensis]
MSPEPLARASEPGDRVPAAPDHFVPRWQEFADAVWLAAHRSRYEGPGSAAPEAPAPAVEKARPQDAGAERPARPPADDDALPDLSAADKDLPP